MVKVELAEVLGNPDEIIGREIYPNMKEKCEAIKRPILLAVYAYYPTPSGTIREMKDMMLAGESRPLSIMNVSDIGDWGYQAVRYSGIDEKQIVSFQVDKFFSTKPRIELVAYEYED